MPAKQPGRGQTSAACAGRASPPPAGPAAAVPRHPTSQGLGAASNMAEDQTGICWSDPCWPWRPLTRITALQYFEHSPFYDPNSNNAAARAQNLDPSNEAVLRCAARPRHAPRAAAAAPPRLLPPHELCACAPLAL